MQLHQCRNTKKRNDFNSFKDAHAANFSNAEDDHDAAKILITLQENPTVFDDDDDEHMIDGENDCDDNENYTKFDNNALNTSSKTFKDSSIQVSYY